MKKAAIHISLNYKGHPHCSVLPACHKSSDFFIESTEGYNELNIFKDEKATLNAVVSCLQKYGQELVAGDLLFFTFCGHGAELLVNDLTRMSELDGKDEALCLYDGHLKDNILFELLSSFKADVKIIVVLDACFSGGMYRTGKLKWLLSNDDYQKKKQKENEYERLRDIEAIKIKAAISFIFSTEEGRFSRSGKELTWFTERFKSALEECDEKSNYLTLTNKLHNLQFDQQVIKCEFVGLDTNWIELRLKDVIIKSI